MARIFCIANQKGGVGKTTTTVNLAAGLAAHGPRVLLVDLDPQGNATMGSGIDKRLLPVTVYDVLLGLADVARRAAARRAGRLRRARRQPRAGRRRGRTGRAGTPRDAAEDARWPTSIADYDFILIDCPPSLSLLTLNGLCAAHGVIVPMQCEYFALEGLSDLVNTIKQVQRNLNPDLHDHRPAARDVRPAHHAAAAGDRAAGGTLRRQGVRHHHPAQRAPGRGAELRLCPAWSSTAPRRVRRPTSRLAPR